ncbi:MAG: transglutaminase domain-containing protein [Chloroflexi bacterium]|nr:transglutaminase domain-containing protein [Chloroflexota bacterium]
MRVETLRLSDGNRFDLIGSTRRGVVFAGRVMGVRGLEGLISYALLGLMVIVVAWSVQLADWGDSPVLIWTVLAGAALGIAFARPRGPWPLRHLVGILAGVVFAIWQVSSAADGANVIARFGDTLNRLDIWMDLALNNGISNDPLPFSVFLSIIAWIVAYAAGWSLFKWQSPWAPSFILGMTVITNLSYRFGEFEFTFYLFAVLAIAMFAHLTLVNTRRRWDSDGIQYSHGISLDSIAAPMVIGVLVVLVAGLAPLYEFRPEVLDRAWGAMKDPFRDRLEDHALRLFPNVGGVGSGQLGAFDRILAFKGRIRFNDEPLFFLESRYETLNPARTYSVYTSQGWHAGPVVDVRRDPAVSLPLEGTLLERIAIEQRIISEEAELGFAIPGDYTLSVDRPYISEELPPLEVQLNMVQGALDPNLPADVRLYADSLREVYLDPNFQVTDPVEDVIEDLLPPDLEIIDFEDKDEALKWVRVGRITEPVFDQVAVRFEERAQPDEPVLIRRLVSQATDAQLNVAGTDYPLWVTDRYLQLPDTLPADVAGLAAELVSAAGAVTPYEKVNAVVEYLRGFGYSQEIEGPGPERDGVAYFLFDTALEPCPGGDGGGLVCDDLAPKGYSQYFGSALAVLLRSQGVPARMVSGFKSGTFDEARAGFLIRDVDSHGWAQAYFPGYGWIDMESTPGEPQLVRGALPTIGVPASGGTSTFAAGRDDFSEVGQLPEGTGDGPDLDELLSLLDRDSGTPVWPFIVGLGAILALSGSVLAWRWRFWAMSPTGRAYASMSRLGWLAGAGRRRPETPMEYALRLGESARDADEGAQAIARAFELEAYGGRPVPEAVHEAVRSEWPAVRWALVRRSLLRLVHVRPRPPLRVVMAEPMERPLYSSLKSTETEG